MISMKNKNCKKQAFVVVRNIKIEENNVMNIFLKLIIL